MTESYKVIYGDKDQIYTDEIIEKKSKFISYIKKVETEQEAIDFINQIKKKHYDATHNCSAFVIGKTKSLLRSNDDGEPSGTAGNPMLDVLLGSDIVNIAAVVTRYYGKIKLGPGGLCRAYSDATKVAMEQVKVANMSLGKRMEIHTDYNTIGKVLHELTKRDLQQEDSKYEADIVLTTTVPIKEVDEFIETITEISAGKSMVEILEEAYMCSPIK